MIMATMSANTKASNHSLAQCLACCRDASCSGVETRFVGRSVAFFETFFLSFLPEVEGVAIQNI